MLVREPGKSIFTRYWHRSRRFSPLIELMPAIRGQASAIRSRVAAGGFSVSARHLRPVTTKPARLPARKLSKEEEQTEQHGGCLMMFRCFETIGDSRC